MQMVVKFLRSLKGYLRCLYFKKSYYKIIIEKADARAYTTLIFFKWQFNPSDLFKALSLIIRQEIIEYRCLK